jgi:hypothetical protein
MVMECFPAWMDYDGKPHQTLEYHSITTSYDYDAMITECRDAHETKFKAVRDVIAKYLPLV